jgi:hypothetical protein
MNDDVITPYSEPAEKALLGSFFADPELFRQFGDQLVDADFFVPSHKRIFAAICKLADRGEVIRMESIVPLVEEQDFGAIAEGLRIGVPSRISCDLETVKKHSAARKRLSELDAERFAILSDPMAAGGSAPSFLKPEDLLDARKFNLFAPPAPARAIYGIGASTISTPGNLTVIAAQAKAGKSALVGAFIAAATGIEGDTLGIVSSNPDSRALIHFDTEQSPADHHGIVATALRRVTATLAPSWLRSYRIVDVPMRDRFGLLEYELERARVAHGGIHSVLLDGSADLVADPNDSAEAFAAVDRLHRLAVTFDTGIVCVLHFNPGSEFNKTRGHLGSQLERKAETNLALEKADGVTVVYTKMARHAHIEKDAGARFQWDSAAGMHLSCGAARDEKAEADDFHLQAIAEEIFSSRSALRYSELKQEIMRVRHVKEAQAERTIKKLVPQFVRKGLMGMYEKA